MTRPLALAGAAVVVLLAGCGESAPIPAEELAVQVTTGAAEVELGRAFPLTVTRVWDRSLVPEEWDAAALAPLVTREVATTRREDGRRVEERRENLAWAFEPEEIVVAAPGFSAVPAGGGPARTARAEAFSVRVRTTLDPAAPGPAELPGGPLDEPQPWLRWTAVAAIVAAAAAFVAARRRRAAPRVPEPVAPSPSPESIARDVALRRLATLRTATDGAAMCAGAAAVLRDFVAARFDVPASFRTTDEILPATARAPGVAASSLDPLARVLRTADRVHFARHVPAPPEASDCLDAAERFVRAQDAGPVSPGEAP